MDAPRHVLATAWGCAGGAVPGGFRSNERVVAGVWEVAGQTRYEAGSCSRAE